MQGSMLPVLKASRAANTHSAMHCITPTHHSVVLAHAAYLPSAELFALLPLAGRLGRTGNENGCDLDYDADSGTVVLKAGRPYRCGRGGAALL